MCWSYVVTGLTTPLCRLVSACFAALGCWEQSAADARECVRLNKGFTKGYLRLATALHKLGLDEEAREVAALGLALDAKCAQLQLLLTQLTVCPPDAASEPT